MIRRKIAYFVNFILLNISLSVVGYPEMFRVDAKGRSKFELRGYLGENKESANYRELPAQ